MGQKKASPSNKVSPPSEVTAWREGIEPGGDHVNEGSAPTSTIFDDPGDSVSQVPSPAMSVASTTFRGRDPSQKTSLGSGGNRDSSNGSQPLSFHVTPASPQKKPASTAPRTTSEVSNHQPPASVLSPSLIVVRPVSLFRRGRRASLFKSRATTAHLKGPGQHPPAGHQLAKLVKISKMRISLLIWRQTAASALLSGPLLARSWVLVMTPGALHQRSRRRSTTTWLVVKIMNSKGGVNLSIIW